MINCLQFYLENGLVKSKTNNLELRKFINETSQEFFEFALTDVTIKNDIRIVKNELLNKYYEEYPDSKKFVTSRTFMKWVRKYSDYLKLNYAEGNSNGQRWFTISKGIVEIPTDLINNNTKIDF
jgi:hypothetical protein